MKKILMMAFLLILLAPLAKAQNISYRYYTDNDYRSALYYQDVLDMLREDGYTISTEQYGTLIQGKSAYYYKTFYPGHDYIIVGISNDDNVYDVDLHVYDNYGYEYRKDDGPDAVALVHIRVYDQQQLKVVIKNAGSDTPDDYSMCRFVIAYR